MLIRAKEQSVFSGRHGWHLDTQIYSIIASLAPPTLGMNHSEAYQGSPTGETERERERHDGDRPTEGGLVWRERRR